MRERQAQTHMRRGTSSTHLMTLTTEASYGWQRQLNVALQFTNFGIQQQRLRYVCVLDMLVKRRDQACC